jgi:hypothetical protein
MSRRLPPELKYLYENKYGFYFRYKDKGDPRGINAKFDTVEDSRAFRDAYLAERGIDLTVRPLNRFIRRNKTSSAPPGIFRREARGGRKYWLATAHIKLANGKLFTAKGPQRFDDECGGVEAALTMAILDRAFLYTDFILVDGIRSEDLCTDYDGPDPIHENPSDTFGGPPQ